MHNPSGIGRRTLWYDEIDSTSDVALSSAEDGIVVVAARQLSGRGRLGRAWHSPKGLGLYFSVGLDGHADAVGLAAALAVRDALRYECVLELKWPNDLLVRKRKICGILVEYRHERTALGIGLNVLHEANDFPPELRDTATSLRMETGRDYALPDLLDNILTELDRRVVALRGEGRSALIAEWAAACRIRGRRVRTATVEGTVTAVNGTGALVLDTEKGPCVVTAADLAILGDEA